jgi:hypothetical protein
VADPGQLEMTGAALAPDARQRHLEPVRHPSIAQRDIDRILTEPS